MRIQFLDVNGVRTRVIYEGDPKNYPVLLIHGFGACAEHWIKNVDALVSVRGLYVSDESVIRRSLLKS